MPFPNLDKIIGIQVFLEKRKTRLFVGTLTSIEGQFRFEYDKEYLNRRYAISLGPEMPLTRQRYQSKTLFIPFSDRIPSRENPAYPEYCEAMGISVEEDQPFILLSTIAHRGPSSFIFEPLYKETFSAKNLIHFRQSLELSVREFAWCFGFSESAITRIESDKSSGREILKRVQIYARHPEVALEMIHLYGGILHPTKRKKIEALLKGVVAQFILTPNNYKPTV